MKTRIKFRKYGVLKFIGHLDVMRYFQKAIRRSGLDVVYSQGFNPHQVMSFAAPLGVGLTSDGEYVDVHFHTCLSEPEMIKRLNESMSEGIEVTRFVILSDQAKHSMSIVEAADYIVSLKDDYKDFFSELSLSFEEHFQEFMNMDRIIVHKKSKKTESDPDIRPWILEYSFQKQDLEATSREIYQTGKEVYMKLATGSSINLKPELVMEGFCNHVGLEFNKFAFQVHRKEIFAKVENQLVPLHEKDKFVAETNQG